MKKQVTFQLSMFNLTFFIIEREYRLYFHYTFESTIYIERSNFNFVQHVTY